MNAASQGAIMLEAECTFQNVI